MTSLVTGGTKGLGFLHIFFPFSLSFLLFASDSVLLNNLIHVNDHFISIVIRHAIVEEFAELGASVHTCSRNEAELKECIHEWENKGFKVSGSVCDVSSRPEREKLMKQVSSLFNGKLNILINNVGTNRSKPTEECKAEDFSFLMATNLESAYHLSQISYPLLKASGSASIIFMSSVCGVVSVSLGSIFAATKGMSILWLSILLAFIDGFNNLLLITCRSPESACQKFGLSMGKRQYKGQLCGALVN